MQIRVATLNVWGLPAPFAEDVGPRVRAIGAHLPTLGLDVVAFQEVWTPEARHSLISAGVRAGLENAWFNRTSLAGGGLLVLSRFPIEQAGFERFALRGLPEQVADGDYYSGKGLARIRLKTDQGAFTLLCTHLQAGTLPRAYCGHRAGQVVQLALAARRSNDPIVAAGDFNFREEDPEYRVLVGLAGLQDVAATLDRRLPTVLSSNPYRGSSKSDRRIDYLFARHGAERAVTPRSVQRMFDEPLELGGRRAAYSIHSGVMADLEIGPGESPPPRPDRGAVELAARLLSEGRLEAAGRRKGGRTWAALGLGCAALSSASLLAPSVTRRRVLRGTLQAATLAALTPSLGFSVLSEIFVPDELRAFDRLVANLSRIDGT